MPQAAPIQTNFTAGELSPRLFGRVDISKYANGLQSLVNMTIQPHGGVTRRGGTRYVSTAKGFCVLIPFEFSVEQSYIIEMSEGFARFYRDGAQITTGAFSTVFSVAFNQGSPSEIVTPYTESELREIQYVQSADVLYLVHPNHAPRTISRIATDTFQMDVITFQNGPWIDENITDTTLAASATTGSVTITASADVFLSTDVGRLVRIDSGSDFGYAEITAYSSATSVTATVVDDFVNASAQKTWRLGAFGETTGYPASVAFYEDRLMFAATRSHPQTVWGSESNVYTSFQPGADDTDALNYTIASDQVNAIRWMSPGKSLVIGTVGGEFIMSGSSTDDAVTPTNVKIVRQSEYGCAYTLPIRADGVVLFLQRSRRKLRQFVYQFESDSYIAPDLSLLSEHITGTGILQMAIQRDPDPIVWAVRNDGALLGMTYERDQEVVGWHRHTFTKGFVESVAVIPDDDGRDQLWLSIRRTINGQTFRYVERMTQGRDYSAPVDADDYYVDAGIYRSGNPVTSVFGLSHLEGETVSILADGAVHPDRVVTGGSVVLDNPASVVSVGLPYTSHLWTLRIEAGSANGTSQGKTKRINEVSVRFYETLGAEIGATPYLLDIIPFRQSSTPMGSAPPRFTGDKRVPMPDGYNKDGVIYIQQAQPLPMTVLAIMPQLRTNG